MRVIVCGGRNFSDREYLFSILDYFDNKYRVDAVIHGGAKGADSLAGEWAETRSKVVEVYAADWDKHGRAAGPRRNKKMLMEGNPDLVIAFEGGKGTDNMVSLANSAGVAVFQPI